MAVTREGREVQDPGVLPQFGAPMSGQLLREEGPRPRKKPGADGGGRFIGLAG